MNTMKSVIIGLSVALAAVIGYSVYLHQGPIKEISTENQDLLGEIDQLKSSYEEEKKKLIDTLFQENEWQRKERDSYYIKNQMFTPDEIHRRPHWFVLWKAGWPENESQSDRSQPNQGQEDSTQTETILIGEQ